MTARELIAVRENRDLFDGVIGLGGTNMTLIGGDTPERVSVVLQTDGNAQTLDARPVLGRGFTGEEERRGAASGVALISDSLWKTRFGSSASALGTAFRLDDRPFTIIGVMAPLYAFPYEAQVWIPAALDPADRSQDFAVFAHMRPGVTRQQARRPPGRRRPRAATVSDAAEFRLRDDDDQENLSGNRPACCARSRPSSPSCCSRRASTSRRCCWRARWRGAASSPSARSSARQARHLRQLLAESLVLAALGCGAGLLLAEWLSAYTATLIPSVLSGQLGLATLHTDWHVAAFAIGVSLASAGIAAVIPAFGSWRANPRAALADGGRTATSGHGGRTLAFMVIAETAAALVLLAGAGLMIQNFLRLRSQPLGFDARGLMTLEFTPSPGAYATGAARDAIIRRVLEEVRTVPGVSAAITTVNPRRRHVERLGHLRRRRRATTERDAEHQRSTDHPGLLETMGIPCPRARLRIRS